MCKDGIVTPLFCNASDCLSKSMIMSSKHKSPKGYLRSSAVKIKRSNIVRHYRNDDFDMPVVESSAGSTEDCCNSPTLEKPPMLQIFSPIKAEKINSFTNRSELHVTPIEVDICGKKSIAEAKDKSDNNNDITNEKLLHDYEAETSSSSIDEMCLSPRNKCEGLGNKSTLVEDFEVDSNHNITTPVYLSPNKNIFSASRPFFSNIPEIKFNDKSDRSPKSDKVMPKLFPILICLDDKVSFISEREHEQYQVIGVPDSPEMPTLIPFSSKTDEAIQIKTECPCEDTQIKQDDADSHDSSAKICQPQVLLQKCSINSPNISKVVSSENSFPIVEGPEMEEIEGIIFFQFRSKKEMEEFNQKSIKTEAVEDMIISAKISDITQMNEWHTEFFAPESQFHQQPHNIKDEDSNQDSISADHVDENENKNSSKNNNDSTNHTSESKTSFTSSNCGAGNSSVGDNDKCEDSSSESEDEKKNLLKDVKNEVNTNTMGAFVSEELDKYLLNSSSLNVRFLQKVNPNIIPISKDAPILSIGKLRKIKFPLRVPTVITLGSSEESTDDAPVANLKSKPKKCIKKVSSKKLKKSLDRAPQRVVLRLVKEEKDNSKGYKVSDVSHKKEKVEPMLHASSPLPVSSVNLPKDTIVFPADGTLPIIKNTLFSDKKEQHLVNEFVSNLNMYGTSKDVAMLVQSNQSYFDEGPVITSKLCAKALRALVINKEYFDVKLKEKWKTCNKYLSQKVDKDKMKLSCRKSQVQKLLDEAESIIPTESHKRSIRLPARYLDSALLGVSECVPPCIVIDDNTPDKTRRQSVEVFDEIKLSEDLPTVIRSSSNEMSSSDSSSEDQIAIQVPQKRCANVKKLPTKKKKIENSAAIKTSVSLSKHDSSTALDSSDEDDIHNSEKMEKISSCSSKILPGKRKIHKKSLEKPSKSNTETVLSDVKLKNASLVDRIEASSSSDSSDEYIYEKSLNNAKDKISFKKTLGLNKKAVGKSLKNEVTRKKRISLKEWAANKKKDEDMTKTGLSVQESDPEKSCPTSKNKNSATPNSKNDNLKIYTMPTCFCKHSSRTILFDYENRQFICRFCTSMKNILFKSSSSKGKRTEILTSPVEPEKQPELSLKSTVNNMHEPEKSGFILPRNKTEVQFNVDGAYQDKLNIADTSENTNSNLINITDASNQLQKQELRVIPKKENVNATPSTSTHTSNKNSYLLLQPLSVKNITGVPVLPVRQELLSNQFPVGERKSTPPILMKKTVSGLVTQSVPSNTLNYKSSTEKVPLATSQPNRLIQIAGTSVSPSFTLYTCDNKDKLQNVTVNSAVSSTNSPLTSSRVIFNILVKPTESKPGVAADSAIACSFQPQQTLGPIIASVCSVQPNAIIQDNLVNSENSSNTVSSTPTPPNVDAIHEDHSSYHKKERRSRKKDLLAPLMYANDESDNFKCKETLLEDEDMEIDVDDTSNPLTGLGKKLENSDSDISEDECNTIFNSNAIQLKKQYNQKNINERLRRYKIKYGFDYLQATSKWFQKATSGVEILNMARTIINVYKKKSNVYELAKTRLIIHNCMLMGKLTRMLNNIQATNVKNITTIQVIRTLACYKSLPKKHKDLSFKSETERKKFPAGAPASDILPLLSKTFKPKAERKKSSSRAPDIGGKGNEVVTPKPLTHELNLNISSNAVTEGGEVQNLQPCITNIESIKQVEVDQDLHSVHTISDSGERKNSVPATLKAIVSDEISVESLKDGNSSPENQNLEEMAQKGRECITNKEVNSDSDTQEGNFDFSGISDDDFDLQVPPTEIKKVPTQNTKSDSPNDCATTCSPTQEKPNKIPAESKAIDFCISDNGSNLEAVVEQNEEPKSEKVDDRNMPTINSELTASSKSETTSIIHKDPYPGVLPMLHRKVMKKNCNISPKSNSTESSHKIKSISNIKGTPNEEILIEDDDDDVTIVDPVIPSAAKPGEINLTKAAETANRLFGPCTVQKVQLKDGKTVFAYKPLSLSSISASGTNSKNVRKDQLTNKTASACYQPSLSSNNTKSNADVDKTNNSTLQTNTYGVRNLEHVFKAARANSAPNRNNSFVSEEIVLLDSDDEKDCKSDSAPKPSNDTDNADLCAEKEKTEEQMQVIDSEKDASL